MATISHHQQHHHRHHPHHQQPAVHDSTFFFVGPFDDTTFCRGPQLLKPIDTSLFTSQIAALSKNSSLTASPISEHGDFFSSEDEDCAVLGDDEAHSEDELPPSPRRRHSGAMSISEEELPFCYDRESLRRDTAAHRERHLQHTMKGRASTFAAHEQWDSEVDGPSMALWTPEMQRSAMSCKRRRVDKSQTMPVRSSAPAKKEVLPHSHSAELTGPMMVLWGV
ncbi:hypothetical protein M406DRAFT_321049 [Cryphonectria parasitica EP155]|uniref:Uncharacterized protein n=1 Tax=Cryphonectria parasitica (strain ATCC 38755 / EP155) TaxID=660469 RepID=A0A9P4Y9B2_CRYP1|nr:uncharacterized protein M406DRAFT_321049 [Cryphonectria parasitica EP155]KAF3768881.1 hypothetical protein M406DRAFT_321049 [Cryphonectria parasitica EP155]